MVVLKYEWYGTILKTILTAQENGVPVVAQWLTSPTRGHEVAGSVPALAQWVKDLVLLQGAV